MDKRTTISRLKAMLLKDVAYLCQRHDRLWSEPIVRTLEDIRRANVRAVLFGGTLRSLLLSRLQEQRFGRPRDVDIVVAGTSLDALRERFRSITKRETRFGGLRLERMNWQFDVWPLHRTWAFLENDQWEPRFSALPWTTFFNLEAIAVDVWVKPGQRRTIYSGDDQFFEGVISRTIEINRHENPFPSLCVVRALVMASSTKFAIGPRLAHYLIINGSALSDAELEQTQLKHYGQIRCDVGMIRKWLEHVSSSYTQNSHSPITLPMYRQLSLWPEIEADRAQLKVHVLADSGHDAQSLVDSVADG
jgi:hypothetical protein